MLAVVEGEHLQAAQLVVLEVLAAVGTVVIQATELLVQLIPAVAVAAVGLTMGLYILVVLVALVLW
jgi:hypothetical protein